MRTTDANGRTQVYLPKSAADAVTKLGQIGSLAAAREWERAALVAAICKPARRGRPAKKTGPKDSYNIDELRKVGIYGLRSRHAVQAYLNAWALSGLPVPELGTHLTLPDGDFPDFAELYPDKAGQEPVPVAETAPDAPGEDDGDSDTAGDAPAPTGSPGPRPARRISLGVIAADLGQLSAEDITSDPGNLDANLAHLHDIIATAEEILNEVLPRAAGKPKAV